MSMFKKLLVGGAVLGMVGVVAWTAPKVSRTKQIRDLLKTHGLDPAKLEINPNAFKLEPEQFTKMKTELVFEKIAAEVAQYLVTGSMENYKSADNSLAQLRELEKTTASVVSTATKDKVNATAEKFAKAATTAKAPAVAAVVEVVG